MGGIGRGSDSLRPVVSQRGNETCHRTDNFFVEEFIMRRILALMKAVFLMLGLLGLFASANGQPTNSFPLWPDGAPGALGKEDKDIPTLTPYLPEPELATGAAMVVCPGGGYGGRA